MSKKEVKNSNPLRKDFLLINNRKISYLDSAATTQKPTEVIASLKEYYELTQC